MAPLAICKYHGKAAFSEDPSRSMACRPFGELDLSREVRKGFVIFIMFFCLGSDFGGRALVRGH